MGKRPPVAAAIVMAVFVSGACTSGNLQRPQAATSRATSASPGATPEVFPSGASILTVAIREAATLDPMRIQDPGAVLIARQLFEGLTRWDPIEDKVVGAVAESWDVFDGGRRFIFYLRPGMTFHDGSLVTAGTFKFAFDRIALKANASDIAYALEDVEGFDAVNQLGDAKSLSGVQVIDDYTLQITLEEPFFDFPAVLTHPGLVPLRPEAVADIATFLRNPVGNGPFQMAAPWEVGKEVTLKTFPGFFPPAPFDGMRFIPFEDPAASWLQFLDGDLDVVEVPAGQIDAAAEVYGDAGYKPFLAAYYFGINVKAPGLRDPRLRKAIGRGIDRSAIAETIYKGTLQPARGIVPAGMPGFQENLCIGLCDHAPVVASQLVEQLKPKDRRITLQFTRGQPHGRVAKMIAHDLKEIGLQVSTHAYDFDPYLKLLRQGDQRLFRLGWIAEYPTPDVFLRDLFHSTSADNNFGYSSPKVDRLLDAARAETSQGKRTQLYIEAERAILRSLPVIPIGSFVTHWVAGPRVQQIAFDPVGGFDAAYVALSPEG